VNRTLPALLTACALALALAPTAAQACGGFFCSSVNLLPVQQNAERILFEVNDDDTITTTVEIRYAGDPDAFSWVVPVTDVPIDTGDGAMVLAPAQTLLLLDSATMPTIITPPTKCNGQAGGSFNNRATLGGAAPMAEDSGAGGQGFDNPVDHVDLPHVGPFDPEVVSSDDPDALIAWLNDNDYLITPEMEPMVAEYVAQGLKFLCMKLLPESNVSDIAPVAFTTPGSEPMVPLTLTGVAAEPEMGVMAFIAAEERWQASTWSNLEIDVADVQADPRNGMSNYDALIAWQIDQAGGKAFVPQFADDLLGVNNQLEGSWSWDPQYDDARAYLTAVEAEHPYITRVYARASAWDMDIDPTFEATDLPDLDPTLDLSDRPAVEVCALAPDEDTRTPCGDSYCGEGASCAVTASGFDGCVCPAGEVARRVQGPRTMQRDTIDTIVCERVEFDMMASLGELDLGVEMGDVCAGTDCGEHGACVATNGFPTCTCDDGYAAVPNFEATDNSPTCSKATRVYGPDALLWAGACAGCSSTGGAPAAGLLALLLGPLAIRLRRR